MFGFDECTFFLATPAEGQGCNDTLQIKHFQAKGKLFYLTSAWSMRFRVHSKYIAGQFYLFKNVLSASRR